MRDTSAIGTLIGRQSKVALSVRLSSTRASASSQKRDGCGEHHNSYALLVSAATADGPRRCSESVPPGPRLRQARRSDAEISYIPSGPTGLCASKAARGPQSSRERPHAGAMPPVTASGRGSRASGSLLRAKQRGP